MADITVDRLPYVYEIGQTQKEVALSEKRLYSLFHTGKNAAGVDSTGDVFVQCDGSDVETTYANKSGKIVLQDGISVPIPPATASIKLKVPSGTGDVSVQIVTSPFSHYVG